MPSPKPSAQDEASSTRAAIEVPDAAALNAMLARGPAELARFAAMDADVALWLLPPRPPAEVPPWLLYDPASVHAAVLATSKQRPDQARAPRPRTAPAPPSFEAAVWPI